MDPFKFTTIAHHGRDSLGPVSDATMDAILAAVRPSLPPGVRPAVLDAGCGKGTWLLRAMARYGATGVAVEPNPTFVADLRERARVPLAARELTIQPCRVTQANLPHGKFDVLLCIGATHAFGDFAGTLTRGAQLLRTRGWLVIGEGFWKQAPAPDYLELLGGDAKIFADLPTTLARPQANRWRLVAHHESTQEEWDDYEGTYAANMHRWLHSRPTDPDAPAFQARIDQWQRAYNTWGRDTLGFVTMVLQR